MCDYITERGFYFIDNCLFTYGLAMHYLQNLGFNIEESLEYLTLLKIKYN
jgi:hypothetical protein